MNRKFALTGVALAALMVSAPSFAADCDPNYVINGQEPSFSDLTGVTVTQCAGFYDKNDVNAGNADALALVNGVLTEWGLSPVTDWITKYNTNVSPINFGQPLYGDTVVSFHWGNYLGTNTNVSAIYRFDAGTDGITSFGVVSQGLSNAALWVTGDQPSPPPIPEPSTYALMLAGLGAVGLMARRRARKQ